MAVTAISDPIIQKTSVKTTDGVTTATVTWGLRVTIPTTQVDSLAHVVQSAYPALPTIGTSLPGKPLVTCRSVSCSSTDINGVYEFTAEYSDKAVDTSAGSPVAAVQENPLDDPPIVTRTASIKPRAVYVDRDGNALLNSARDPMIESIDDNILGYKISCKVAVNYGATIKSFRNTCNDAAIVIDGETVALNAARLVLSDGYLSDPKTQNGYSYRDLNFEIAIDDRDLHYAVPADAGFRELVEVLDSEGASLDPAEFVQRKIIMEDGSEPSDVVFLSDGLRIIEPTPETVEYREFKLYPEADYSVLPGITAAPPP